MVREHSSRLCRNSYSCLYQTSADSAHLPTFNNLTHLHDDPNIALKIQNYVENESLDVGDRTPNISPENNTSALTSSCITSSGTKTPEVTSSAIVTSTDIRSLGTRSSEVASSSGVTSLDMTSSDTATVPGEDGDLVEVQGVLVKLRKKVPRNVEPGGGHEALLSRRMKKSLCTGWSEEDNSGWLSMEYAHNLRQP